MLSSAPSTHHQLMSTQATLFSFFADKSGKAAGGSKQGSKQDTDKLKAAGTNKKDKAGGSKRGADNKLKVDSKKKPKVAKSKPASTPSANEQGGSKKRRSTKDAVAAPTLTPSTLKEAAVAPDAAADGPKRSDVWARFVFKGQQKQGAKEKLEATPSAPQASSSSAPKKPKSTKAKQAHASKQKGKKTRAQKDKSTKKDKASSSKPTPKFAVGARVEAKFDDGSTYYPGTVTRVGKGGSTYAIKFDDGDKDNSVPAGDIRAPVAAAGGVDASPPSEGVTTDTTATETKTMSTSTTTSTTEGGKDNMVLEDDVIDDVEVESESKDEDTHMGDAEDDEEEEAHTKLQAQRSTGTSSDSEPDITNEGSHTHPSSESTESVSVNNKVQADDEDMDDDESEDESASATATATATTSTSTANVQDGLSEYER